MVNQLEDDITALQEIIRQLKEELSSFPPDKNEETLKTDPEMRKYLQHKLQELGQHIRPEDDIAFIQNFL